MPTTQETTWRAGRFWWDCASTTSTCALRAVVFDLDALTDIECDGHRVAYNAAFAAHGLDFEWSVVRYRQLLALSDERQRVAAELRKRGVATEVDVLTKLLADEIYTTKTMLFDELILERDLAPRPGLVDFVMDAVGAGMQIAVVTNGQRGWAEPLVRQLVGEGLVESVVSAEDVVKPTPDPEAHRHALWELGVCPDDAIAITGSASGLRAANSAGMPTVVITGEGTPDIPAALAVRPSFDGANPLRIADCQRLHTTWWKSHKTSAA
ncbi:haloacid dehalogenase superfamily, subfamily IA, variant 3 with third motif having DD or ED [Mycolicibacterium rutilum]|uniref:Haloacid dehalogenase superfamily, subfamily IA, variant 3 with third motif having DD or ED n=1 Tax=Mycolicibacterium rutilum TaxID=370526 RepID=A0A1H6M4R8_MYCRU|nr:HAD-IA family hydrolase [Mycolicibacterium rutilum]SEH92965.1 haloacid dehalogenase superfamily, subfamily IA, variant 3 with third motif having DD or ED [Mycolicibacterium rutilum]